MEADIDALAGRISHPQSHTRQMGSPDMTCSFLVRSFLLFCLKGPTVHHRCSEFLAYLQQWLYMLLLYPHPPAVRRGDHQICGQSAKFFSVTALVYKYSNYGQYIVLHPIAHRDLT